MADTRTCIGSVKFGIARHEAPVTDFPVQASQKDGLGRMCRPHWQAYTRALRNGSAEPQASVARKRAARVAVGLESDAEVQRKLLAKVRTNGGSIPDA